MSFRVLNKLNISWYFQQLNDSVEGGGVIFRSLKFSGFTFSAKESKHMNLCYFTQMFV